MSPASPARVSLPAAIARGLRCRCPRCGVGRLYRGFYSELPACEQCGLEYGWYSGEVLGFLYMSTALVTGVFVIAMFLWRPENLWVGRAVIVSLGLVAFIGTLPFRKGAALGLKFWLQQLG